MLVSPLIILPLANVHFINPRVEREASGLLLTNAGLNPIQGAPPPPHHLRVGGDIARAQIRSLGTAAGSQEGALPHLHTHSLQGHKEHGERLRDTGNRQGFLPYLALDLALTLTSSLCT